MPVQNNHAAPTPFHENTKSTLEFSRWVENSNTQTFLDRFLRSLLVKAIELHIYIEEVKRKGLGRGVGPELPAVSFSYEFFFFL